MKTTILSGKYEIVETNLFFLDDLQSDALIHVVIHEEEIGDLRFRFAAKEGAGNSVRLEMQEEELVITFYNFNSPNGIGTNRPISIGEMEGKKLKIHIWSYLLGEKVRKVEYSIYREL